MKDKVLILLRGVPGAGKSTLANYIWNGSLTFEADKFFDTPDGGYKFDATKLKEAHEWCRLGVETAMEENIQTNGAYYQQIVVSNTFTREWEMQAYIDLANEFGYKIVSLIVENRHGGENVHGVPADKVQEMRDRFEIKL